MDGTAIAAAWMKRAAEIPERGDRETEGWYLSFALG